MTSGSPGTWWAETLRNRAAWLPAAAAAVVIAIAILANAPPLFSPFFLVDDGNYVVDNAALQELPMTECWRVFTSRTNPWEYLPLRDLSYRIDMALFGLHPAGFRAHNLFIYALTCAGVWWFAASLLGLFRQRSAPGDRWAATIAMALFAAHPAHVESVAWISGRKDLLSGLFAVWSLALFTGSLRPGRPCPRRLAGAYLLFACAILSKSTVVTIPVVAWLIAMAQPAAPRRWWPDILRSTALTAPLFLLAAASVALQMGASIAYAPTPFDGMGERTILDRAELSTRILGTLTQIAACPRGLRLTYDVGRAGPSGLVAMALAGAAVPLGLLGLWLAVRRRSIAGLGLAMAFILMLPFLQIIPFNTWSYASERFLFLPVLGFALVVAVALGSLPGRAGAAVAVILVALGMTATAVRSKQWSDAPALIADNAARAPTHPIAARTYIVHVLCPTNRFAEASAVAARVCVAAERTYLLLYVEAQDARHRGDIARLKSLMPTLLPMTPRDDLAVRVEIANLTLAAELTTEAEQAYRNLLRDFAAIPEMRYNLGLALERQGRHAEAAVEIEAAIAGGFKQAKAWNNLGLACRDSGRLADAANAFRSAMRADPTHWHAAYNLARLLWARGDQHGALHAIREARERAAKAGASSAQLDEVERAIEAGQSGRPTAPP
jgi:protein O-mannosyl-transferase